MNPTACGIEIGHNKRELNEHGSYNFPIAIYNDNLYRENVPWHWHDEFELIVVTHNKLDIRVGNKQYIVEEGDGLFINSEAMHFVSNCNNQEGDLKSIVFHHRLVGGNSNSIFYQKYLIPILKDPALNEVFLSKKIPWQKRILEKSLEAHEQCIIANDGYEFKVREELSSIMFDLFKHRSSKIEIPSQKTLRDAKRSKDMLNYINTHYSENISVGMIAANSNISESEVLRCFKNTLGTTPMQYVINFRLQRAAELMISTSMKIVDIALDCGFGETSYFTKKFKNEFNMTPTVYRERFKNRNL